jgi:GH15 family glucan-1,4-alpha-glucosidase
MSHRIEDYALIGDTHTVAVVCRDGSIDWLCLPRFDSPACFAALLGDERNGRWRIAPAARPRSVSRRYRDDTLVLETDYETDDGAVRLIDFMPRRGRLDRNPQLVRMVEGLRGTVTMELELTIRFDYGLVMPWVRRIGAGNDRHAVAGPDAILFSPDRCVDLKGANDRHVAEFAVCAGDRHAFTMAWHDAHEPLPRVIDVDRALVDTETWWREWADRCTYEGPYRDQVMRSLLTLRALAYDPTGGIIAAATSSLPEEIGGERNWDYRYCWLRDAALTLDALMLGGYRSEARAWRDWLLRAVAGDPRQLQIMYSVSGERRLEELEAEWLSGFAESRPVRFGNAAAKQFQLDVYGEVADALHEGRRHGIPAEPAAWALERALLRSVVDLWRSPDEGIWEVRGERRHFTHSKVMAWVAVDRGIRAVEEYGLDASAEELARWGAAREEIFEEVLEKGYDADRRTFTQSFGSTELDASLLLIPIVGFLPPTDERVLGTIEAVQRELMVNGLVMRYSTHAEGTHSVDGLEGGEGAFLVCSFWLADCLCLAGRVDEARALFERLVGLRNDVGLLSEEYDAAEARMLGNFPQAFSHVGVVRTALSLKAAGALDAAAEGASRGGPDAQVGAAAAPPLHDR